MAVVLLYHRVAELAADPQLLAVTPQRFDEQLHALRRIARVVPLGELVRGVREGIVPDRAVAITFDDGYADNLTHAAPLLQKHDAPATVFVTARGERVRHEFWWDDLERLLLHDAPLPTELSLHVDGHEHAWSLPDINQLPRFDSAWNVLCDRPPRPRKALYLFLSKLLRPLCEVRRRAVLQSLATWANLPVDGRPSHATLTDAQLLQLSSDGLVEIGAHTVTHPVLANLSRDEQRFELEESRRRLEAVIGRPVTSLAYPFGCRMDFNDVTVDLAREAGYEFACANSGREPSSHSLLTTASNLHRLPRAIVRNVGGDELARQLAHVLEQSPADPARGNARAEARPGTLHGAKPARIESPCAAS
ncbi:Polysaccharide deacetylase [Phycisphaerae bacterium RAS2]|nr:Polysaccharide deacetylase [Phycisphaerae bacterium RAS2]